MDKKQSLESPPGAAVMRAPLVSADNAPASLHQRLLNPPVPRSLDVHVALSTAWHLYTRKLVAYILWGLLTSFFMNGVSMIGNAIWLKHPENEPVWLLVALTYAPIFLFFPLTYGPFVVASNSLRPNGSGFTWRALFLTGYKYYFPILGYMFVYSGMMFGCMFAALPFIIASSIAQASAYVSAIVGMAVGGTLYMFLAIRLCFASSLFLEYHDELGFFETMALSYKGNGRVFWKLVVLVLACGLVMSPSTICVLIAPIVAPSSTAALVVAYACFFPLMALAMPFVTLAFAAAFDQVFGMNEGYNGNPDGCVTC